MLSEGETSMELEQNYALQQLTFVNTDQDMEVALQGGNYPNTVGVCFRRSSVVLNAVVLSALGRSLWVVVQH